MVKGVHHIGASVQNLDEVIAFYQTAVQFEKAIEFRTENSQAANQILQLDNIITNVAMLNAATTYLELFEFESPIPPPYEITPVSGPGITHICYQSPANDSAFDKFKHAGMQMVSRGDKPVKLARPDILYAYARDVAGNMFETELWNVPPHPYPVWIAHVAYVTHNIERLVQFYSQVILQLEEVGQIRQVVGLPNLDVVANLDNVNLLFLQIPARNILLEFWQFLNPPSSSSIAAKSAETLGYTHVCFEVDDVKQEYKRLVELGVPFLSAPVEATNNAVVYGRDPDGNLFELLQFLDRDAPLSLDQL